MITKLNELVSQASERAMRNRMNDKVSDVVRDVQHNLEAMSEMDALVLSVITPEAEQAARDAGGEIDYSPFASLFDGFTARQKFGILCSFKARLHANTFGTVCQATGLSPFILTSIPTADLAKVFSIVADRKAAIERGEPVADLTLEEMYRLLRDVGLEFPGFEIDEPSDINDLVLGGGD